MDRYTVSPKPDERVVKSLNLYLGQVVEFELPGFGRVPKSKVIGVDHYSVVSAIGPQAWDAFTLASQQPDPSGLWNRWYLANIPNLGVHFFHAVKNGFKPPREVLDQALDFLSGNLQMNSEGDASLSGGEFAQGRIVIYPIKGEGPARLYSEETFNGVSQPVNTVGHPYLDCD